MESVTDEKEYGQRLDVRAERLDAAAGARVSDTMLGAVVGIGSALIVLPMLWAVMAGEAWAATYGVGVGSVCFAVILLCLCTRRRR